MNEINEARKNTYDAILYMRFQKQGKKTTLFVNAYINGNTVKKKKEKKERKLIIAKIRPVMTWVGGEGGT